MLKSVLHSYTCRAFPSAWNLHARRSTPQQIGLDSTPASTNSFQVHLWTAFNLTAEAEDYPLGTKYFCSEAIIASSRFPQTVHEYSPRTFLLCQTQKQRPNNKVPADLMNVDDCYASVCPKVSHWKPTRCSITRTTAPELLVVPALFRSCSASRSPGHSSQAPEMFELVIWTVLLDVCLQDQ